jgi:Uma2 family endonuclease
MANRHLEHKGAYYYDFHPTQEDLMGETAPHRDLVSYLAQVLTWIFHGQSCAIYENLNFYQTDDYKEYPLAPDIAVIKGAERLPITSWRVGKTGPAPQVVFEIASVETWKRDLEEKPMQYGQMGIKEYFAYDPNERPVRRKAARRLWGWQLDKGSGDMHEMLVHPDGRLWSQHLESFLVPDGNYLRLTDSLGRRHLTEAEAQAEARRAAERRAEAEARRAEMEAEARRAAEKQAEALAEKLRAHGIDPDSL